MLRYILMLIVFRYNNVIAEKYYDITALENNGIIFEQINMIQFYTKKFNIITSIKVPDYKKEIYNVEKYIKSFESLCASRANEKNSSTDEHEAPCYLRGRQERHLVMKIKLRNNDLAHLLEHHERRKRGLINGLGSVLKYVGGTMSSEDAVEINDRFQKLEENQNNIMEIEKDQLYMVTSLRKNVNTNIRHLFEDQNKTRILLDDLLNRYKISKAVKNNLELEIALADIATSINLELSEIERHQKESMEILSALQAGILHPVLVSKNALDDIYNKIKINIKGEANKLGKLKLSRIFKITSEIVEDTIIINIQAPIPEPTIYQVNKIYLLPVQISSQATYMIYNIKTPYIVSDIARTRFMYMSISEYDDCKEISTSKKSELSLCEFKQPEITNTDTECEIQLLKNTKPAQHVCKYKMVENPQIIKQMTNKNKWIFNFQTPREVKILTSEHKLVTKWINGTGIIEIFGEGQLRVDQYTYRVSENTKINITLETPDEMHMPRLPEMKFVSSEENFPTPLVTKHHEIILESGENMNHWIQRVKEFETRRKIIVHNKIGYGVSTTIFIIIFVVLLWLKFNKSTNDNTTTNSAPIIIELPEMATHRTATQLNQCNSSA